MFGVCWQASKRLMVDATSFRKNQVRGRGMQSHNLVAVLQTFRNVLVAGIDTVVDVPC